MPQVTFFGRVLCTEMYPWYHGGTSARVRYQVSVNESVHSKLLFSANNTNIISRHESVPRPGYVIIM